MGSALIAAKLGLDHDLGVDDTIWPVVELLVRAAFEECPFDIGIIHVHSANPAGARKMVQALQHWGAATASRRSSGRCGSASRRASGST
jgi:hypothetical protein